MLKPTLIALATVIGVTAALPSLALAIDKGPCHYCTMEPIVVKGDRKKTKSTSSSQIQTSQPSQFVVGQ